MVSAHLSQAADILQASRKDGRVSDNLPETCRPQSREEGYQIQAVIEADDPRIGWKIAATSLDGQKHIGVNGPLAGRILSNKTFKPGASVALGHNKMAVAEPEFAFKIGTEIKPNKSYYKVKEVMELVETLHLAIELPDSRFNNFSSVGELSLIADNACADQFVFSKPVDMDWKDIDFSNHKVSISNSKFAHQGIGSNVLGDPKIALTWFKVKE